MTEDELRARRAKQVDAARRKRNIAAKLRGEQIGLVDAIGVRSKARKLFALGWSYEAIIQASGCTGTAAGLRLIANGTSRRCERKFLAVAAMPYTLAVPTAVADTCIVPSLGAARRVQALMAQGWRHEDISEFIGRASHHISSERYPKMMALDWHLVDDAFERLSASHGGSAKSLTRARVAGYVPAFCWDDIDDPDGKPVGVNDLAVAVVDEVTVARIVAGDMSLARFATKAERVEVVRLWRASDRSLAELERLSGWAPHRYARTVAS